MTAYTAIIIQATTTHPGVTYQVIETEPGNFYGTVFAGNQAVRLQTTAAVFGKDAANIPANIVRAIPYGKAVIGIKADELAAIDAAVAAGQAMIATNDRAIARKQDDALATQLGDLRETQRKETNRGYSTSYYAPTVSNQQVSDAQAALAAHRAAHPWLVVAKDLNLAAFAANH